MLELIHTLRRDAKKACDVALRYSLIFERLHGLAFEVGRPGSCLFGCWYRVKPADDTVCTVSAPKCCRSSVERGRRSFELHCRGHGACAVAPVILALVMHPVDNTGMPGSQLPAHLFEIIDSGHEFPEERV